jgi:vacuolar iron transporter family protein
MLAEATLPSGSSTDRNGGVMETAERHHRDVTGGWLRPAVFGVMDGLVSNLALMAGVAGGVAAATGGDATREVITAGLAGLAAGAFSMAAGEWVSVSSQSELARAEIERERTELALHPQEEAEEFAQMWISRGIDADVARAMAEQVMRQPDLALEVHSREELGLTLEDLPSPWVAGISSFIAFALGAFVPVLPYLLGATTVMPAVLAALVGLFVTGALTTLVTIRTWWFAGLRQVLIGGGAAGLTYLLGTLVGGVL